MVIFVGLYIEMAALMTLGDWLKGSGWTQALTLAEIYTSETVDFFLCAFHVTRTRRAHQITAATLYIFQRRAYDHYRALEGYSQPSKHFRDWCRENEISSSQFLYWTTVLSLKLTISIYVRSLKVVYFTMYLNAFTEIVLWFFVLDHTNYVQWISVHLCDMTELPQMHLEIYMQFKTGHFTNYVKDQENILSTLLDAAHE